MPGSALAPSSRRKASTAPRPDGPARSPRQFRPALRIAKAEARRCISRAPYLTLSVAGTGPRNGARDFRFGPGWAPVGRRLARRICPATPFRRAAAFPTFLPADASRIRSLRPSLGMPLTGAKAGRRNPCSLRQRCPERAAMGVRNRPRREVPMNFDKYTDRARGFVQSAQSLALREGHQQFAPEHLLKILLDDPEGLAAGLIDRAGGNSRKALADTEAALAKRPKVEGGGAGQLYLAPGTARVFDAAQKAAEKAGDGYVTVERLLLALAIEKDSEAGKILARADVTPQNLNAAINALRKGRTADSASAENAYDALKKYARDLTQAARDGKIDPVIGRDEEIRRTVQVLSRRTKNNPVLIGEPGVGK